MDKINYDFGLEDRQTSTKKIQKLDEEKEKIRLQISDTLVKYHQNLVASGKPANYILTYNDVARAVSQESFLATPLDKHQVDYKILLAYYSTQSLNDVLAALNLPHRPRKEF